MKSTKIHKGLVLVSVLAGGLAFGCELIVDFDRTRIPSEQSEASVDGAVTGTDSGADATDGATDGAPGAAEDADATSDAPNDG